MTVEPYLQSIVMGLTMGALYSSEAIGISIVFGVTRILNVAYGAYMLLAAYLAFLLTPILGVPFHFAVPLVTLLLAGFGLLTGRFVFRPALRLREEYMLIFTFGLAYVMENVFIIVASSNYRLTHVPYGNQSFALGGVAFPVTLLLSIIANAGGYLGCYFFVKKTDTGRAMLATAHDADMARLSGINSDHMYYLSFVVSSLLAGLMGSILSISFQFAPSSALDYSLNGWIVLILGGTLSFGRILFVGVGLGLVQQLVAFQYSAVYADSVAFLVLFIFLVAKRRRAYLE